MRVFRAGVLLLCIVLSSEAGVFPGAVWETAAPADAGLDAAGVPQADPDWGVSASR